MKLTITEILDRCSDGDKVDVGATASFIGDFKEGQSQHGPYSFQRLGLTGADGGKIYLSIFNKGSHLPPRVEEGDRVSLTGAKVEERNGKLALKATADQVTINGAAGQPAASQPAGQQQQRASQAAPAGRPPAPDARELSDLWIWHYGRAVEAGAAPDVAGGGATSLLIARSEGRCGPLALGPASHEEPSEPGEDDDDIPF